MWQLLSLSLPLPQEVQKGKCEVREVRERLQEVEGEREGAKQEVKEAREKLREAEKCLERERKEMNRKASEAVESRQTLQQEMERVKLHHSQEVGVAQNYDDDVIKYCMIIIMWGGYYSKLPLKVGNLIHSVNKGDNTNTKCLSFGKNNCLVMAGGYW